jgi:hypothetical protein
MPATKTVPAGRPRAARIFPHDHRFAVMRIRVRVRLRMYVIFL